MTLVLFIFVNLVFFCPMMILCMEETDANFTDQNVQRHSVTSHETARSLAYGPSWGGGGGWLKEKYKFCFPRELQRLLPLFCQWEESVGGA